MPEVHTPPTTEPQLQPLRVTWTRALMPTAILACLTSDPLHGYAIAQALGQRGFGIPKGGSLYPALGRLEDAGLIVAEWVPGPSGPARRQYSLTSRGRMQLSQDLAQLRALVTTLEGDDA